METNTFTFARCRRCRWTAPLTFPNVPTCPGNHRVECVTVTGKVREEVRCTSSCVNARGGDCECSCGGKDHGRYAA